MHPGELENGVPGFTTKRPRLPQTPSIKRDSSDSDTSLTSNSAVPAKLSLIPAKLTLKMQSQLQAAKAPSKNTTELSSDLKLCLACNRFALHAIKNSFGQERRFWSNFWNTRRVGIPTR
eukprot:3702001-Rhodomonas_salina.1